ncbi:MAG: universal stress protein [Solirubrobacteraceae bacterium]
MFNCVVVGVDGRHGGREALWLGRRLGGAGRGAVVAVHVYPRPPLRPLSLDADLEVRAAAKVLLNEELSVAGVEARARVTSDTSPGRGLHRIADGLHADVLVVGSSHNAPLRRVMAGDTVRAVLAGSRRPVAVATGGGHEPRPVPLVVVGYDGGPDSRTALDWAGRAAETLGGRLHVVCVAEPPIAFTPGVSYSVDWTTLGSARERHAKRCLDEGLELLGGNASGEVATGLARKELRRISEHADLLVLGSRGYGPVRRTLVGSTSDHLVHHAACPVIVVPRGAARAQRPDRPTAAEAHA